MPKHAEQRLLPYTAEQLYELVVDVERYPEFLPWCASCRITKREAEYFFADLIVGYKVIREKFTSKVILNKETYEIRVEYKDGPMRHLSNHWRFIQQKNGSCMIYFYVDFEFKNIFLQRLMGVFFDDIIKRMIGAFESRAHAFYGSK